MVRIFFETFSGFIRHNDEDESEEARNAIFRLTSGFFAGIINNGKR
jgi:hypothetical protein